MGVEKARELIREAEKHARPGGLMDRMLSHIDDALLGTDNWIRVEERLPEDRERVLAYVQRERKVTGVSYFTFDFVERRGEKWMNVNESGYWLWSNAIVTHWKPLEPPQHA